VTIGIFDGVHAGHQCTIRRTVELARERGSEEPVSAPGDVVDVVLHDLAVEHGDSDERRVDLTVRRNGGGAEPVQQRLGIGVHAEADDVAHAEPLPFGGGRRQDEFIGPFRIR